MLLSRQRVCMCMHACACVHAYDSVCACADHLAVQQSRPHVCVWIFPWDATFHLVSRSTGGECAPQEVGPERCAGDSGKPASLFLEADFH